MKRSKRSTLYAARKQSSRLEAANDTDGELMELWFAAHRSRPIEQLHDRVLDPDVD
jgi:hypothetical protein